MSNFNGNTIQSEEELIGTRPNRPPAQNPRIPELSDDMSNQKRRDRCQYHDSKRYDSKRRIAHWHSTKQTSINTHEPYQRRYQTKQRWANLPTLQRRRLFRKWTTRTHWHLALMVYEERISGVDAVEKPPRSYFSNRLWNVVGRLAAVGRAKQLGASAIPARHLVNGRQ